MGTTARPVPGRAGNRQSHYPHRSIPQNHPRRLRLRACTSGNFRHRATIMCWSKLMTQYYGNSYGSGSRISLRTIIGIAIILFGIISYYGHESVNPTTGEKQHVSMTADDEISLGLQSAPQMSAQMGGDAPPSDPRAQEVAHI